MILPESQIATGVRWSVDDAASSSSGADPGSCTPARIPGDRAVGAVVVDEDLVWVVRLPTLPAGIARPASPGTLAHLTVQLARELAAATGRGDDAVFAEAALVDAAARVVSEYLSDLPDLPLIGEPFGGEEGID